MDEKRISEVAKTIISQLLATVGQSVLLSWGIRREIIGMAYNGLPGVTFYVSGRLFEGIVTVLLNDDDTYKIIAYNPDYGSKTICDGAYCDNFGRIIDEFVESGDDKDEYKKFCEGELKKLLNMGMCMN